MATYRILNNDLFKDAEGRDQLFLHIEIDDGVDIWRKAERCCQEDIDLMLADKANIVTVATKLMDRSIRMRPKELIAEEEAKTMRLEEIKLETAKEMAKIEEFKALQETTKLEQIKLSTSVEAIIK